MYNAAAEQIKAQLWAEKNQRNINTRQRGVLAVATPRAIPRSKELQDSFSARRRFAVMRGKRRKRWGLPRHARARRLHPALTRQRTDRCKTCAEAQSRL